MVDRRSLFCGLVIFGQADHHLSKNSSQVTKKSKPNELNEKLIPVLQLSVAFDVTVPDRGEGGYDEVERASSRELLWDAVPLLFGDAVLVDENIVSKGIQVSSTHQRSVHE